MMKEKDPARMPGESARAVDTFRKYYTTDSEWKQSEKTAREQAEKFNGLDYSTEFMCMISYLSGYAPKMPLQMAVDMTAEIVKERRRMD